MVITTAQLQSTKLELRFAQVQILLAVCRRFAMVGIVCQPYHKINSSLSLSIFIFIFIHLFYVNIAWCVNHRTISKNDVKNKTLVLKYKVFLSYDMSFFEWYLAKLQKSSPSVKSLWFQGHSMTGVIHIAWLEWQLLMKRDLELRLTLYVNCGWAKILLHSDTWLVTNFTKIFWNRR